MKYSASIMLVLVTSSLCAAPPTDEAIQKIRDAAPAQAPAKPAKPRKLLVFNRAAGFRHSSIETGTEAMRILGDKSSAFTTDATDDPAAFTTENLKGYDAICLLNTTGNFLRTDEQKKALMEFVKSGKGVVGIHSASDAFYDWPEYGQMIGGYFDGHPWNAADTVTLKIDDPGHPINKPFANKPFTVTDEIYQFKPEPYSREVLRVLTSLDTAKTNMDRPGLKRGKNGDYAVSWVRKFGEGRVFYCSLGHREDIYWNTTVMAHYLAGTQFALGDLDADVAPSSVVKTALRSSPREDRACADCDDADDDALLTKAEEALDAGDNEKAVAIYTELSKPEKPEHVRIAALRGLAESSDDGIQILVDQLSSDERQIKIAAVRILQENRDPRATEAIVKALQTASPPVQAVLADALAVRGDKVAAPAVAKLAGSPDAVARLAAVKALGKLGGAGEAELLARVAAGSRGELRDTARRSLATLRGRGVNEKIISLLSSAVPAVAVELVRALGERQADDAVAQILPLAGAAGAAADAKVRREAFRVLGELAAAEQLDSLLGLLVKESDPAVLPYAERAVLIVAQRMNDNDKAAAAIGAAIGPAQGAGRAALLRLLSNLGGDAALRIVRAELKSGDSNARDSAARALASWPTPQAAPDLLELARPSGDGSGRSGTTQILALRGYIRLAGLVHDPAERIGMYRQAMELAQRPDEKRLALAGLSQVASRDALALAKSAAADPSVKAEAEQAVKKIEQELAAK